MTKRKKKTKPLSKVNEFDKINNTERSLKTRQYRRSVIKADGVCVATWCEVTSVNQSRRVGVKATNTVAVGQLASRTPDERHN